jgi:hypothetical protein
MNSLFELDDERITDYEKEELLKILSDNRYHSPEDSETDEEGGGKRSINVYSLSWRSEEVRCFCFNIFIESFN